MITIQFKKLNELAKTPTRGSVFAAGYDLYATEEYTLVPMERKLFKTGITMAISSGVYGCIAPRSGLALKNGIDIMAGIIDEDYRGDIGVILINLGDKPFEVKIGDKIAQIIFEQYNPASFQEVDELSSSIRGIDGFGSTDLNSTVTQPNHSLISNDKDMIKIRGSSNQSLVEPTNNQEPKYNETNPYNNTGKSNLLEKWKQNVQVQDVVGYEKIVKERES